LQGLAGGRMTAAILTALTLVAVLAGAVYILARQRKAKRIIRPRSDRHEHALWLLGVLVDDPAIRKVMLDTRSVRADVLDKLKVRSGELPETELLATVAALLRDRRTRKVAARHVAERVGEPEDRVRAMLSGLVMEMRGTE